MRRKTLHLVITFNTTTEAMAMEDLCKSRHAPGCMIPVPQSISAGCGLCWCAQPDDRETLQALMQEAGLEPENITECMV
jgi:hypothetical protein